MSDAILVPVYIIAFEYTSPILGNDILVGGAGNDWIDGSYGNDVIYPGPGSDYVLGGPGFDIVLFAGDLYNRTGVYVDLSHGQGYSGDATGDIYVSVEGVTGTFFDDILVGDQGNNLLDGKEGNDIIIPLDGFDVIVGGEGSDTYVINSMLRGSKIIRNYARDRADDLIDIKKYQRQELAFRKNSTNLMIYVGDYYNSTSFCPFNNSNALVVENWFAGPKMQHLKLKLAAETMDLMFVTENSNELLEYDPQCNEHSEHCQRLQEDFINTMYDVYDDVFNNTQIHMY